MTTLDLHSIQNENGGGLSTEVSGKYTSVRHELAKLDGKLTAGEAAKIFGKIIGQKIYAKSLVNAYKIIMGREPEWHHGGFYKNSSRKSTMGRTFFFTYDQINELAERWNEVEEKEAAIAAEEKRKQEAIVKGFFYSWDHDYSGNYGKKRNYKVLGVYEGPEAGQPQNFTFCNDDVFAKAKEQDGKKYFGWDEPKISDFM